MKRVKRRYLALSIDSDGVFGSKELLDVIWSAISRLFGEYGASRMGLGLISYDMERRFAVIRVLHTAVDMIRAALASITKICDRPAAIHVLTVSGTIRALYKKMKQ